MLVAKRQNRGIGRESAFSLLVRLMLGFTE